MAKNKKGVFDKSSVNSTKIDKEMVAQNQDNNGGFMVEYSCKQKEPTINGRQFFQECNRVKRQNNRKGFREVRVKGSNLYVSIERCSFYQKSNLD